MMTLTELLAAPKAEQDAYQAKMQAAFERVRPTGNWKTSIDATVEIRSIDEVMDILEAVTFFTGGEADWNLVDNETGVVRFTAPGYYQSVGA